MTKAAGPEHVRLELSQLRRLELASLVEATTLVLLVGVAVPLKHFAGQPTAVAVMGPIHGLASVGTSGPWCKRSRKAVGKSTNGCAWS